jgi:hypothetical protein
MGKQIGCYMLSRYEKAQMEEELAELTRELNSLSSPSGRIENRCNKCRATLTYDNQGELCDGLCKSCESSYNIERIVEAGREAGVYPSDIRKDINEKYPPIVLLLCPYCDNACYPEEYEQGGHSGCIRDNEGTKERIQRRIDRINHLLNEDREEALKNYREELNS